MAQGTGYTNNNCTERDTLPTALVTYSILNTFFYYYVFNALSYTTV